MSASRGEVRMPFPVRSITRATSSDPKVYVERFGEKYLTVFNDGDQRKDVTVALIGKVPMRARDLIGEADLPLVDGKIRLSLDPQDVAVIFME